MTRPDPLRNFRFRLEIDNIDQAGFAEATVGESTTEPIEYREGDEIPTVRKLSSLTKYGNVTLKWGITESMALSEWYREVTEGATLLEQIRKNVVVRVQDEAGQDRATWEITRAWPSKYTPSPLNGTGNEVAIDTLELSNEGIRRTQ
ncbi:phage tail protein [Actinoplanes sp. NPDC048796]|uniref:phage tail protein n=1 Tax=unclassified Actinoplanes TaxID=2626549 RepID=UPI0033CAB9E4